VDISRQRAIERENAKKAKDLATLLDVSQAMAMTLDLASVSQTIIEKASELVGLDTGAIYLLRGSMLYLEATTPPLPPGMPENFRVAKLDDHPHIRESFRRAQPVAIEDTAAATFTPQEQAIVEMRGLRSLLYIPLIIERRPIGVLIIGSIGRTRVCTPQEIDLCRTFSVQAAVTAENAMMFDTTARYARELEARILERDRAQQERTRLEEQLYQAQRRESIGTLAAGIAHDFNNILSIIVGNASLLAAGHGIEEKEARRLEAIVTAANRATQVVQQLLTIARKTEMVRRPTDVNKLIHELGRLLEETFPRQIRVRQDLHADTVMIDADPNQLHQVLLNLCVNARDAMPSGGELVLSTRLVRRADLQGRFPQIDQSRYVEISVRDTGTGMDETTRAKAFTPFFTTKGVGHGTGLGLAVSLGIVESHGGFMDVQSQPGIGTTMIAYLPAGDGEAESGSAIEDPTASPNAFQGTVLLVEDEPLLRDSTAESLALKGFSVLTATNGDEALEVFQKDGGRISLVLSDLGLPGFDGEELLRRLRAAGAAMPFVLMTGFVEAEQRTRLLRLGVRDIVMKPFEPSELLLRLRKALHP
jgi:signal transduction histidine kinase